MRITDLLKKQGIQIGVSVKDKAEAIEKLVALHEKCGNLKDRKAYKEGILKREEMGTTAIGMEIAIPHAKSEAVKAPALSAITVPDGVDYGSPDGEPCKLIFMIAATTDGDVHLEVLARMMQMLMDMDFTAKLKAAKDKDEFLKLIDEKETEKFPDEVKKEDKPEEVKKVELKKDDRKIRVLAVTACPTGIAHTYMAAEALNKAAEKMGITIKVETNGSGGAKNVLTAKEIAEQIGAKLEIIELSVLEDESICSNPEDRCYHCKTALMSGFLEKAYERGIDTVADGTNADDDFGDRPGMRALEELGIVSPLREAGLTKADIRILSKELGLPTWDKPSMACLATRIPTGTEIVAPASGKVMLAENRIATGWTVIIEHLPGLYTMYYHMSGLKVKEGQTVQQGDLLGPSGATGFATGPHLHWEVRLNSVIVNPDYFIENDWSFNEP